MSLKRSLGRVHVLGYTRITSRELRGPTPTGSLRCKVKSAGDGIRQLHRFHDPTFTFRAAVFLQKQAEAIAVPLSDRAKDKYTG